MPAYTVPDAWGRVSRLTKTARNRTVHLDAPGVGGACGPKIAYTSWITTLLWHVTCRRCLRALATDARLAGAVTLADAIEGRGLPPCWQCKGTGRIFERQCGICHGDKVAPRG